MALTGSLNLYTAVDTGLSESVTLTYPSDLPSNHPNYDKRGTTETLKVPEVRVDTASYDDVYINIHDANISLITGQHELHSTYRIYGSEASKSLDKENYLFQGETSVGIWDWDNDTNPYSKAYTHLKTQGGWENLTDI